MLQKRDLIAIISVCRLELGCFLLFFSILVLLISKCNFFLLKQFFENVKKKVYGRGGGGGV